ncbi:DUF1972 domain-containing protein [Sphingomonas sanguinis]|uniref:DUF1972 domain-containing protein n=1 Tax=Sphingomonas sanguinis TaxID=33051 RepID=A0A147J8F5_9SPHN|nr:DUF1972 domain-containing protein [Sphingomonas sanguinis]KTW13339.1 hypothetical protein NS258_09260 [Sphingomonas sanguinis]
MVPLVGTVGVPARYGGFETLAEQLCRHTSPDDVQFLVYCEAKAYSGDEHGREFAGHSRVFLPLRANGVASMFHDALALLDAVFRQGADEIFIFGYSGAWILPILKIIRPRVRYIVNVDGMEWRRDKFSTPARLLLKGLEWCAARTASVVIADNAALADLFRERYRREPVVIAYGGDHTVSTGQAMVPTMASEGHYLAIARIEPENNTEMIIKGCMVAGVPLVFIGNWKANAYGVGLRERYGDAPGITLLDPIYDQDMLAQWRSGAVGYIHGHSVGGTNPSLVEALFHTDVLASFDCSFNRATLSGAGGYFTDVDSLAQLLRNGLSPIPAVDLAALRSTYRWDEIAARYRGLLGS